MPDGQLNGLVTQPRAPAARRPPADTRRPCTELPRRRKTRFTRTSSKNFTFGGDAGGLAGGHLVEGAGAGGSFTQIRRSASRRAAAAAAAAAEPLLEEGPEEQDLDAEVGRRWCC